MFPLWNGGPGLVHDEVVVGRTAVTGLARKPWQTLALASAGVALSFVRVDSRGVTVAGFALHPGVSPEVGLALVALAASEARPAVTLASVEVALLPGGA